GGQLEDAAQLHQLAIGVPPTGVAVRAAVHGDLGASEGEADLYETLVPAHRTRHGTRPLPWDPILLAAPQSARNVAGLVFVDTVSDNLGGGDSVERHVRHDRRPESLEMDNQ